MGNRFYTVAELSNPLGWVAQSVTHLSCLAILFITCGVQGAGKTILAKLVEKEHKAIRLTPDDWLRELFPDKQTDLAADTRAAIEALHWSIALRALEIGTNLVLDFGLWSREERDRFRSEAQALGPPVVLLLLDPPRDELLCRLARLRPAAGCLSYRGGGA